MLLYAFARKLITHDIFYAHSYVDLLCLVLSVGYMQFVIFLLLLLWFFFSVLGKRIYVEWMLPFLLLLSFFKL